MVFKSAFIAHTPDAEPLKHHWIMETSMYRLFTVFVRNQEQAINVCRKLVREDGVQSIILCPGFTHANVAGIAQAVGESISVNVARGDGPSSKAAIEAMTGAGWFPAD
ncbi:MAG: hypothetical protein J7K94_02905 [Dehalococcoidia bacterium]|nr:hypothetical protein [Dehalococcoidia bacterium]